jgi:hypothetical protein
MKNFTARVTTRKIGNLILNRLFHYQEEKMPDDFGVLITASNIESHLAKIRAAQELWAEKNPKMNSPDNRGIKESSLLKKQLQGKRGKVIPCDY